MRTFELTSKRVSDARNCTADFIAELSGGLTLASATVTASTYSGDDTALTLGSANLLGSTVFATASGGTAGTIYQLAFAATLSDGQVVSQSALLAITPDTL